MDGTTATQYTGSPCPRSLGVLMRSGLNCNELRSAWVQAWTFPFPSISRGAGWEGLMGSTGREGRVGLEAPEEEEEIKRREKEAPHYGCW